MHLPPSSAELGGSTRHCTKVGSKCAPNAKKLKQGERLIPACMCVVFRAVPCTPPRMNVCAYSKFKHTFRCMFYVILVDTGITVLYSVPSIRTV